MFIKAKDDKKDTNDIDQKLEEFRDSIVGKKDFSKTLGTVILVFNSQDVRKFVEE